MTNEYLKVYDFVVNYGVGGYIFPRVLKTYFNIGIQSIYGILNQLVEKGTLQEVYEIQCSKCGYISKVQSIDKTNICNRCKKEIAVNEELILLYKKI